MSIMSPTTQVAHLQWPHQGHMLSPRCRAPLRFTVFQAVFIIFRWVMEEYYIHIYVLYYIYIIISELFLKSTKYMEIHVPTFSNWPFTSLHHDHTTRPIHKANYSCQETLRCGKVLLRRSDAPAARWGPLTWRGLRDQQPTILGGS